MPVSNCTIKDTDITWIDAVDPTSEELSGISEKYNLNSYALLDCLDPDHLPKFEEHNDTHFLIIRVVNENREKLQTVQSLSCKIAIFYNESFIITVHRTTQPLIAAIKENYVDTAKVKTTTGIVIHIVRDALHSFEQPAIDLSNEIDGYESKLFLKKNIPDGMIEAIYYLKNRAGLYKKLLLLSNEIVNSIRAEGEEAPALRDVHDLHTKLLMLNDQVQEDAKELLNIYLSLSARKTNDVMKVLTIFSVFFMPLTFIAGIYGMNFKFMPELNYYWAYPITLLVMVVVSLIIFLWFKRKKWL
ncbi:magnesium transporter CorA [Flavobacterium cupreum]|uniref:Magnesium transporter CorA n=1 Tax=Flavobacterium cupreum TaxID=2133766 RepID=A0A434ACI9_9FLAO|nr:CorA family divalent cation transporter [Flavobacterium cupreum]RUT72090.1 magnesium transporter CorA [Flavobacterium cupreum]